MKRSVLRCVLAGLILPVMLVGGVLSGGQARAASGANCDNNAVIYCGASSVSSLIAKYNNGDSRNSANSIQAIFSSLGISGSDIQAMGSNSQIGNVTSSGNVFVNNQLVATNALTAGRQNIAGSTRHMSQGTLFFTRPPRVSFQSSPLSAFVVMKNGVFQFAILISCGNPVIAQPKPAPSPPPKHPPATPPKPSPSRNSPKVCSGDTTNTNSGVASQGGNCSTNTTNNSTTVVQTKNTPSPPPASTPQTPAETPAPPSSEVAATAAPSETVAAAPAASTEGKGAPEQLPNTGAGNIVGIFGVTSVIGTVGYRLFLGRYLRHL